MKKLLFILPSFLFTIALNARQTEDEVHIGSATCLNFKVNYVQQKNEVI